MVFAILLCYTKNGDKMKEWIQELELDENKFIITEMSKKFSLSNEEYINLVNLIIYYYTITSSPNTLEAVATICNKIITYRSEIEKNQNHGLFQDCLTTFLQEELQSAGNLNRIQKFLNQGFIFHSFNPAFYDPINEKGLVAKEKPWNLEEVEAVREIFQRRNKKNIFGLYQGREKTPLFFANNLMSSAYYGLSSPTFFRKFIENNPQYFNTFLNRDYAKARESINSICLDLEATERNIVLQFFEKYWSIFATNRLPYIAISTKKKLKIPEEQLENTGDTFDTILKKIMSTKNFMIHEDISRDCLEIFDYESFSITPIQKEKNI